MEIQVFNTKQELAESAAMRAAEVIRGAIKEKDHACIVAATGVSQFEFLDALAKAPQIDWSKTVFFHLDEYISLSKSHPASFKKYLTERIVDRVHPGAFHFINGHHPNPALECRRPGHLLSRSEVDVAFVGIGMSGHLAFNDPPADFKRGDPFIVVELDEVSRKQQLSEGWFKSLDEVPKMAISMSIHQILKSRHILCVVPGEQKAIPVRDCLELEISPLRPASILRRHPNTILYLDKQSAALLSDSRKRK